MKTKKKADKNPSIAISLVYFLPACFLQKTFHGWLISIRVFSADGHYGLIVPFISKETAIQSYDASIMPHFDYCSPVWDCLSGYLSDKLQKLQNRAVRIITKSPFDTSSDHLLFTLDWERLFLRQKKQKALMMFKSMNGLAPEYLQSLFSVAQFITWGKTDLTQTKYQLSET